jgi:hypothetical protein
MSSTWERHVATPITQTHNPEADLKACTTSELVKDRKATRCHLKFSTLPLVDHTLALNITPVETSDQLPDKYGSALHNIPMLYEKYQISFSLISMHHTMPGQE